MSSKNSRSSSTITSKLDLISSSRAANSFIALRRLLFMPYSPYPNSPRRRRGSLPPAVLLAFQLPLSGQRGERALDAGLDLRPQPLEPEPAGDRPAQVVGLRRPA